MSKWSGVNRLDVCILIGIYYFDINCFFFEPITVVNEFC